MNGNANAADAQVKNRQFHLRTTRAHREDRHVVSPPPAPIAELTPSMDLGGEQLCPPPFKALHPLRAVVSRRSAQ
jgi:hypothetical protein